ncbi:tyrosine-type recombinase/integrase [Cesiribacter sp. SM1]|uniref:tyrosine-type recombinase/integrase n=1 Tax=Cesiribacter sp. SM1 TaxID=2861196 RepID=UPI001CD2A1C1|nr:tyrosine-type recombinase/integrase [Cesiribacter sp. SM1]
MIANFLRYLAYERRYSAHTLTAYEADLGQFEAYLQETYALADTTAVTHLHLRSWVLALVEGGMSTRSVNRKLATLRSYYKFLLKREAVQQDPTVKVRAPKVQKGLPHFVQEAEMDRLLDNIPFPDTFEGWRDRLVLELLYGTGIRLSELLQLRVSNVNLHEGVIKVLGKRNKERVIPMAKPLQELVRKYIGSKSAAFGADSSAHLLVTDKGEQAYPMFVYRLVRKYLGTFTSSEKQSPHVLRHTFATHLLNRGADLNAVKDLLGHSSLAATQVYTHNSMEKLRKVFEQAHPKA